MARAAVLGRLNWTAATIAAIRSETDSASTLVLDVPGWPGHVAGQHVDVRLTAPDGYSTQRSYSIASAPQDGRLELTVQRIADGEVSPYLVGTALPGDQIELRGPVGGYFTWQPDDSTPVLLVGGGSGIVPLMSMLRARAAAGARVPFRLVYSTRSPETAIYAEELDRIAQAGDGVEVDYTYTRKTPPHWPHPPGRLDAERLRAEGWPP